MLYWFILGMLYWLTLGVLYWLILRVLYWLTLGVVGLFPGLSKSHPDSPLPILRVPCRFGGGGGEGVGSAGGGRGQKSSTMRVPGTAVETHRILGDGARCG